MSPQLTRKFAEMIGEYDFKYPNSDHTFDNEEKHKNVCIAMFRSVLTPYVYKYDDEIVSRPFTRNILVQNLDRVPGLRTLYLTSRSREDDPAQLARMICHLRHLQEFTYRYNCTDEVIEQLGLHCTHLKKVFLFGSSLVTNASVQHLLKLRKLQFLNMDETLIDDEHYGLLLTELPQIKDISFRISSHEDILNHVAEKDLHKISHVRGTLWNLSTLTHRCRYIANFFIQVIGTPLDLSSLLALTTSRTLKIAGINVTYNLNAVLTGIGPRLTQLSLIEFVRVNLQDIVTLCPTLAYLSLWDCEYLPLDPKTPLVPQLPHFRNLISLRISKLDEVETIYNYHRHYSSLKKLT
jgi:hypothetical protein